MEPDAQQALTDPCHGEPFLLRPAGECEWYAGTGSITTAEQVKIGGREARAKATSHVERILARLPQRLDIIHMTETGHALMAGPIQYWAETLTPPGR